MLTRVDNSKITPRKDTLRRHHLTTARCLVLQDKLSDKQLEARGCPTRAERAAEQEKLQSLKELYEIVNISNTQTDGTEPFPENEQQTRQSGIGIELKCVLSLLLLF